MKKIVTLQEKESIICIKYFLNFEIERILTLIKTFKMGDDIIPLDDNSYNIIPDELKSLFERLNKKYPECIYKKVTFSKGENILKQGSFFSHQTILLNGLVKIVLEAENKKNYIFKLSLPGEFIGLSALFHDETSPFSAICMCDSEVGLIKQNFFEELFWEDSDFQKYVMKLRSGYFRLVYEKLKLQATRNSYGKLAHVILYIKQLQDIMPDIYKYITRKDIADLAGVSLESVMKILNEFKGDRIININDKDISINAQELLERLVIIG